MTPEKLEAIIQQGEGVEIEFKTSLFELNKDAFESICAFLNRKGGHLVLGVKNDRTVEGVMTCAVQDIINHIIINANNPQKLNPPFYLSPQLVDYKNQKVIYLYVPESSQVHSTCGKIFDRNEEGDLDITRQPSQVTQLYLRKQTTYSENQVFPYVELVDLKSELFKRIRILADNERPGHPWKEMTDEALLRSAGLYKKDPVTGKHGHTLAAVMLLGKDETIIDVLPHHKTDALLRVENTDRYDDRDDIRINLIESYDRLMAFIAKHLPDKFYQEDENRSSLRDRLFREVVSNLLIHREFTNGFPAKLIIEKERVYMENWNRPHNGGLIDPVIARFFREIGRVDELGSGVRNTFKYCGIYTRGATPEFIEGDIFKTIIPLKAKTEKDVPATRPGEIPGKAQSRLGDKLGDKLGDNEQKIIALIWETPGISIAAMAEKMGISTTAVENNIKKLRQRKLLERIGTAKKGHWKINCQDTSPQAPE